MANKKDFEDYVNAQATASALARDELAEWFEQADISDPVAFRDALIEVYTDIAYKYGLMSALAGAEFYKNERDAALGESDFDPYIPDIANLEQLEKHVRYAMGHFVFPSDVINGG